MRPGPLLATAALVTLTACSATSTPLMASTSSSPAASSVSASPTPVSTATWVDFSWPAAGFAVKLPANPRQTTSTRTVGLLVITLRAALTKKLAHQGVLVGGAHFSQSLPSGAVATELRSSVYGFAASSGATLQSASATMFRGLRAYQASLVAPNGALFSLIGFLKDSSDEIMVLAPQGAMFNAVTASLRLL